MSDATDFDLVILGGGMTGLTLGYHLAQQEAADPTDKPQALILGEIITLNHFIGIAIILGGIHLVNKA